MLEVQLSVVDQSTPQLVLSVPGVQGAAGVSSFSTIAGATYTLSDNDRSRILRFTSSSNVAITVPPGLSANFDCMVVQAGTGQLIFSAGSGVVINSALSATRTAYRYAVATLIPLGGNAYILSGEVTA